MSSSHACYSITPLPNKCFNKECRDAASMKGWLLRSGECADLCGRCAFLYEEGGFCDAFHLEATGWRSCESCWKRLHCGCIASVNLYIHLDAGGVECFTCAAKSLAPLVLPQDRNLGGPPAMAFENEHRAMDLNLRMFPEPQKLTSLNASPATLHDPTLQRLPKYPHVSSSSFTPLFEKMLSASDAGRIGRLVLPKKCAEAYFPSISEPEGLPLTVHDSNGKEWVFQFRFWPNNNSRMYVLEGVTPCIQTMQLQAGDTVTFSRMEPEGKLMMGYRKASVSVKHEDAKSHARKRKSKPLAEELFPLTWEEAQGVLRSLNAPLSVVVVEGFEFEEYADAPILGGLERSASAGPDTATTKHPRHREGCACIVCIQAPSGRGPKHKATCQCSLCSTVKHRFKTLRMNRQRKRASPVKCRIDLNVQPDHDD